MVRAHVSARRVVPKHSSPDQISAPLCLVRAHISRVHRGTCGWSRRLAPTRFRPKCSRGRMFFRTVASLCFRHFGVSNFFAPCAEAKSFFLMIAYRLDLFVSSTGSVTVASVLVACGG